MKNLGKKSLIIVALLVLSVVGVSYAFFDYYKIGKNSKLIAGDIYLDYIDKTESISLTNIYPENAREARSRTDNVINFSVAGGNTSTNTIYYEVRLNEGDEISGKTRFDPKDIKIDLSEVNSDGTETLLFGALSFDEFKDTKIWVDKVKASGSINKNYKLRFWLSRNVLISDTEPDADYSTSEFENSYVSIKVTVYGDFEEKELPYSYMASLPQNINAEKANITSVNFVEMDETEMTTKYNAATIKADVTDTAKSEAGSVLAWLETNADDTTKYTMYVASDKTLFFPVDSSYMFNYFTNLVDIHFGNIETGIVTNMTQMFTGCTGLTSLDLSSFDTSSVTDMRNMFLGCSSLTSLNLSNFDTSNVTYMSSMFSDCLNLTSLDVSDWDTSKVTNMSNMFFDCSGLTNLDVSGWNTSEVNNMQLMFYECLNLTSLDVSGWDTGGVTNMTSMFFRCSSLTDLDVSNWNTENVTNMMQMFLSCSSLTSLNVSNWNTQNVTDMSNMFHGCSGLTSLDVSNFDVSSVTNVANMFVGCKGLTSLDVSNWNTGNVTNMTHMFYNCESLTSLDVSGWDTSGVTNMSRMFYGCSSLTTIYSNTDWNNVIVTSSESMFYDCPKLVGAISYSSSKTDVTYANPTTGYFTKKTTA